MKTMKKSLSVLLAVLCCLSILSVAAFAADVKVSMRIEGISETFFNDELTVAEGTSVLDAIKATGVEVEASNTQYGLYVSSIGGDEAGKFGGWDGWLYTVNGEEVLNSIDAETLSNGDDVLVYYGDPYGVGFQYPDVKFNLRKGTISITSVDTTFDENYNSVKSTNPVAGSTITINGKAYITDENGNIKLASEDIKKGTYTYTVERYAENGLPTVLRTSGEYKYSPTIFEIIANWFKKLFNAIKGLFVK